ncbi:Dabb family protein [Marinilabiliaceae bacterium ANBcel2]|nr:Dabb family protein [Marinilabiliaceae bacterium ANBcel2]
MVKHIVLFKLKSDIKESVKKTKLEEIKTALEDLSKTIPELNHIEAGINSNPDESFDLALTTHFNSWEDLKAYVIHPDHQKVALIIREVLSERACVDYEC